ncbi:caspase family protein [Desulfobacterales bacterium HSG2]|nr:caspase family protein [Desulfobacterales bacterium HSG2]
MKKRAICVGINNYPGTYNDLNGCINDANDWKELLRNDFDFGRVSVITDENATRQNILIALNHIVTEAGPGDVVVFTYSGHGTSVPDRGKFDEADNRDEAICAYDGNITDDEVRKIIRRINRNAHLAIISDSCHSGTVTRSALERTYDADKEAAKNAPKARYMPPKDDINAIRVGMLPPRQRIMYPESDMPEILLSGCNANEYSYDAYMNGRYNGAMTATAINLIKSNPGQTYGELHKKLRQLLPSASYPQSPQLEGSKSNKNRKLFAFTEGEVVATTGLKAAVTVSTLNIRSGPGVDHQEIGNLYKDDVVNVINMDGKEMWVEIEPGKWAALAYDGEQYMKLKCD